MVVDVDDFDRARFAVDEDGAELFCDSKTVDAEVTRLKYFRVQTRVEGIMTKESQLFFELLGDTARFEVCLKTR